MAGVSDEKWEAIKTRRAEYQRLAKNPTENMTVYRMQGGDPGGSLGVHWSTDPNVSHHTGLGGPGGIVHRGIVNPDQIISQSEWMGGNIRSHHFNDKGEFQTGKTQWGLDMEAEVRLRPGSTVREHATAPGGVHEYTPTGREPTIEERGRLNYVDLAHHAVQGTPEANRLHQEQGKLPHVQQSMLEPVVAHESGQTIGYTPKWDLLRGRGMSLSDRIDFSTDDVNRIGKAAGLGEWEAGTERAHEPLLAELRQPPVSQAEPTHRRVANQMQFEGF